MYSVLRFRLAKTCNNRSESLDLQSLQNQKLGLKPFNVQRRHKIRICHREFLSVRWFQFFSNFKKA